MTAEHLHEDIVTVMFTDVAGFTDMTNKRGDAAAREIIDTQRQLVREQLRSYEGREIDQIGDGFMIAFRSTRKGVACAVAIQDAVDRHNEDGGEPLRLRIGLNVGEVIEEGGHPFGAAVNGASRVAGEARGGEILVSEPVKQLAGTIPGVSFRDRGRFRLKGFSERWRLYEVEAPSPTASPRRSVSRLRPAQPVVALAAIAVVAAAAAAAILFVRNEGAPGAAAEGGGTTRSRSILIGRSIGDARLGMTEEAARSAFGGSQSRQTWASRGRSGSTATFSDSGASLAISFFDGRAVQLRTRSPAYATEGGIRVGLGRVPNPGIAAPLPGSNWREALTTGDLLQTGPNSYIWRGFAFSGRSEYCSSGEGAVTMLILDGTKIKEIRVSERRFVPDQLPLGADTSVDVAPCDIGT